MFNLTQEVRLLLPRISDIPYRQILSLFQNSFTVWSIRSLLPMHGQDAMSGETRDTLLYCQLQEGLRLELMKAPAVSGTTKYQELCVTAKKAVVSHGSLMLL